MSYTTETGDTTEAFLDGEDYQDQVERQEDQQEAVETQEMFESAGAEVPYFKKSDSLFALFQKVWNTKDSSKVANLDKFELGQLNIKVRDAQYLGLLGHAMHHDRFAMFFRSSAEIILSTSASKKGWFTELFVSQKKFTARSASVNPTQNKKKWSLFGSNNNTEAYDTS